MLQYSGLSFEKLKAKLSQFPDGSIFVWSGNKGAAYQELVTFAASRGLILN